MLTSRNELGKSWETKLDDLLVEHNNFEPPGGRRFALALAVLTRRNLSGGRATDSTQKALQTLRLQGYWRVIKLVLGLPSKEARPSITVRRFSNSAWLDKSC